MQLANVIHHSFLLMRGEDLPVVGMQRGLDDSRGRKHQYGQAAQSPHIVEPRPRQTPRNQKLRSVEMHIPSRHLLLRERQRGRRQRIHEQLPIFIVEYIPERKPIMTAPLEVHVLQPQRDLLQVPFPQLLAERPEFLQQVLQGAVFVLVRYDETGVVEADLPVDWQDVGVVEIQSFVALERDQTHEFVLPLPVSSHVASLCLYAGGRTLAFLLSLENEFLAGDSGQLDVLDGGRDGPAPTLPRVGKSAVFLGRHGLEISGGVLVVIDDALLDADIVEFAIRVKLLPVVLEFLTRPLLDRGYLLLQLQGQVLPRGTDVVELLEEFAAGVRRLGVLGRAVFGGGLGTFAG